MMCGLSHQLADEDVLQIQKNNTKKVGKTVSNLSANALKLMKGESLKNEKKVVNPNKSKGVPK